MKLRSASALSAAVLGLLSFASQAVGQVRILSVAPATVQPGSTFVMTGSGFPAGVSGANVKVQFAPVTSGAGPTLSVPPTSLTTVAGTTLRATVSVPVSLVVTAPTPYQVTLSATVAPVFATATPGRITINPPPSLSSVNPGSGQQGQTLNAIVTGSFTNFYQGISTATFGPGITVNSIGIANAGSLTANITIAPSAAPGANNVVVTTGSEIDTLTGGFTVVATPVVISSLSFAPSSVPLGIATSVTATATISGFPVAGSVQLQRLDSMGRVLATLGTLSPVGSGGTFNLVTTFTEFAVGPISLQVTASAAGATSHVVSPIATLTVTGTPPPTVTITAPTSLSFLNLSPTTVNGSVSDPTASVAINSVAAAVAPNGNFSAQIPLAEGPNIITATATATSGAVGTASETVSLDTTPPHVTVTSPSNQFISTSSSISVSGNVNDIVVGTVNSQQVTVTVNGIAAQVANRTFLAPNVPLGMGSNTITAVATDRAGNSATTQITVTLQAPSPNQISLLSGNNQSGTIGSTLAAPLVVSLTNSAGAPAANAQVIFTVTQNNGMLIVGGGTPAASVLATTNAQGQATASWTLGMRSGAGSDGVQAYSVGASGTAVFTATANQGTPGIIVIDSGNNQTGAVNQALAKPLIAVVVDAGSNRLANVPVTFTVKSGGGNLGGPPSITVNTDSDGRAQATPILGFQEGTSNNLVTADFPNDTGYPASFTASGRGPGNPTNTIISGVVLDNNDNPVPGVTVRAVLTNMATSNSSSVQVAATVQTDMKGQFSIYQAPVGLVYLYVDGSTATVPGPFPTLNYDMVTIAGQLNTVGQPIYLLPIKTTNQLCVTGTTGGGTLTIPEAPGFSLTFGPGQVTFPGGSTTGCVSVTTVHPDKIPMVPGFGQQPRFIVTIQPSGAIFNPPAPITLPNVDGLAPRAVTEMYSFDHDIGSFVAIGIGTVSADGQVIASNAGVGVLKAGWHCGGNPTSSGAAAQCGPCAYCDGQNCRPNPTQGNNCQSACIVGGTGTCQGGYCTGTVNVGASCGNGGVCDQAGNCVFPCVGPNCGGPCVGPNCGGGCANCNSGNPCIDDSCSNSQCIATPNNLCQNACNGRTSGSCAVGGVSGTCDASGNCNLCGALGNGTTCSCGGGSTGTCSAGQCTGCPPQLTITVNTPSDRAVPPPPTGVHSFVVTDLISALANPSGGPLNSVIWQDPQPDPNYPVTDPAQNVTGKTTNALSFFGDSSRYVVSGPGQGPCAERSTGAQWPGTAPPLCPGPALAYQPVSATADVGGSQLTATLPPGQQILQDSIDILREEYLDFGDPNTALYFAPTRDQIAPPRDPKFNWGYYQTATPTFVLPGLIAVQGPSGADVMGPLLSDLDTNVVLFLNNLDLQRIPVGVGGHLPSDVAVGPRGPFTIYSISKGQIQPATGVNHIWTGNTDPQGDDLCNGEWLDSQNKSHTSPVPLPNAPNCATCMCIAEILVGPNGISETTANNRAATLELYGEISSAYRNPQKTTDVPSSPNSYHTKGRALDFAFPNNFAIYDVPAMDDADLRCLVHAVALPSTAAWLGLGAINGWRQINAIEVFAEHGANTFLACEDPTSDHVHIAR